MYFLETLEALDKLNENGAGGQRTYKDFLVALAAFLQCPRHTSYNESWALHHRDLKHFNNSDFENLILMNDSHHKSFHRQVHVRNITSLPDLDNFLKTGTTKKGEKFDYWLIGKEILNKLNTVNTETDFSND